MMNNSDDLIKLKSAAAAAAAAGGGSGGRMFVPIGNSEKENRPSSPALSTAASSSVAASPHWQRLVGSSKTEESSKGFSPLVAFCFAINYILGTGFLTIPWAFTQGGLLLSTALVALVGIMADVSKNYLLETMARAEAMLDTKFHWHKRQPGEEDKPIMLYSPMITKPATVATAKDDNFYTTKKHQTNNADDDDDDTDLETNERNGLLGGRRGADNVGKGVMQYKSMDGKKQQGSLFTNKNSRPGTPNAYALSVPGTPLTQSRPGTPTPKGVPGAGAAGQRQIVTKIKPPYMVKERKFEVNTLCRIYLGKVGLNIYTTFICLYIYCTLWAYTSVFSSAMARAIPIIGSAHENVNDNSFSEDDYFWNYTIYALIFAAFVIPMSCLELHEQITIQVLLTGCRFLMLGLMLGTCQEAATAGRLAAAAATETTATSSTANLSTEFNSGERMLLSDGASSIDWSLWIRPEGIHKMLPIVVFAHIYHHSIPGLSHPVQDKSKLRPIFAWTTAFSTVAYSLIGIFLGAAFTSSQIEQSSNLNWHDFSSQIKWWGNAIKYYILLFPACDVVSAFPLNAITLGNNVMGWCFGRNIHKYEKKRAWVILFRLIAACPPILLGIWIRELGKITDYAGTTGFVIGFSFPALLYLKSKEKALKKNFRTTTFYQSYASSDFVAWIMFTFGVVMLLYVSYELSFGTDDE